MIKLVVDSTEEKNHYFFRRSHEEGSEANLWSIYERPNFTDYCPIGENREARALEFAKQNDVKPIRRKGGGAYMVRLYVDHSKNQPFDGEFIEQR